MKRTRPHSNGGRRRRQRALALCAAGLLALSPLCSAAEAADTVADTEESYALCVFGGGGGGGGGGVCGNGGGGGGGGAGGYVSLGDHHWLGDGGDGGSSFTSYSGSGGDSSGGGSGGEGGGGNGGSGGQYPAPVSDGLNSEAIDGITVTEGGSGGNGGDDSGSPGGAGGDGGSADFTTASLTLNGNLRMGSGADGQAGKGAAVGAGGAGGNATLDVGTLHVNGDHALSFTKPENGGILHATIGDLQLSGAATMRLSNVTVNDAPGLVPNAVYSEVTDGVFINTFTFGAGGALAVDYTTDIVLESQTLEAAPTIVSLEGKTLTLTGAGDETTRTLLTTNGGTISGSNVTLTDTTGRVLSWTATIGDGEPQTLTAENEKFAILEGTTSIGATLKELPPPPPPSSGPSSTTETTQNPDGSTTTTVTRPDGTVIETVKQPDGTKTETTTAEKTQPDGSVVKTETVVQTDKDGNTTAGATVTSDTKTGDVTVPSDVLDKLSRVPGATLTVTLPGAELVFDDAAIAAIIAAGGRAPALTITPVAFKDLPQQAQARLSEATTYGFSVNGGGVDFGAGRVSVTLDYTRRESGTAIVVYYVSNEGALTRMPGAKFQNGAVRFETSHWSIYAVTEETPRFTDVAPHAWYYGAVADVCERGLMNGTAETVFSPDGTTTRAMLFTVLARLGGHEFTGGETWYSAAMDWAKTSGITDGSNPMGKITREQLAAMLHRHAGSPAVQDRALEFADADEISPWALDALRWAISEGIVSGKAENTLDPQGSATRAEVAAMLQRYVTSQ